MKVHIELEVDTAMELLLIHDGFMSLVEKFDTFKNDPITTSKAIRATNEYLEAVANALPTEIIENYMDEN